ncbi:unnamed protein product [Rhizophagus irregularis]|nr:unnamed protein product [Rhizophagus irregularis]
MKGTADKGEETQNKMFFLKRKGTADEGKRQKILALSSATSALWHFSLSPGSFFGYFGSLAFRFRSWFFLQLLRLFGISVLVLSSATSALWHFGLGPGSFFGYFGSLAFRFSPGSFFGYFGALAFRFRKRERK